MTSHPSRNWRVKMRASIDEYKKSPEYEVLTQVPVNPQKIIERFKLIAETAYKSGYKNGRDSKK